MIEYLKVGLSVYIYIYIGQEELEQVQILVVKTPENGKRENITTNVIRENNI